LSSQPIIEANLLDFTLRSIKDQHIDKVILEVLVVTTGRLMTRPDG